MGQTARRIEKRHGLSVLGVASEKEFFSVLQARVRYNGFADNAYYLIAAVPYLGCCHQNRFARFRIHKFRTMVANADKIGTQVTVASDSRITKVGKFIRKCRLDEVSQLIDVLTGNMTFVGTRPEVPKYVEQYTDSMKATLLLPAGVTSEASIKYKDEDKLLESAENADETYVNVVLPKKMTYNLWAICKFGFWRDIGTMFKTVFAVLKR